MKLLIDCRCGCDILCIEKLWNDDEWNAAVYYFNMYRSGESGGFFYRLKCAWEYFRSGEFAYSDMTVERKDIEKMIEFLKDVKEPCRKDKEDSNGSKSE